MTSESGTLWTLLECMAYDRRKLGNIIIYGGGDFGHDIKIPNNETEYEINLFIKS